MTKPVVTRFAPSPPAICISAGPARRCSTGSTPDIPAAVPLRIEDTDRERSTEPAIKAILDGLRWLELDWDGEPIYQAARAQRHREVTAQLLADGKAYRCYASPEELSQMREAAKKAGRSKLYDGRWRDRDPSEAPPGVKPVIRLKAPLDGETVVEDRVQGRVVWQNADLDDMIIPPGATARRSTITLSSSTITTWASRTSSAASTT